MRHARNVLWAILVLSLVCVVGVDELSAASTTYGTLRGQVVDGNDSPLAGATVVIQSPQMVREKAVLTDREGSYFVAGLPPGRYTVEARMSGFGSVRQETTILLDKTTVLAFKLTAGERQETVVVTADRPVVSKTESEGAYNLRKDLTESIPIGRSYQSLLQLAPGVANTGEGDGNPNILGGTQNSNTYLLDGVSITDAVTGTFGSNINYDSIEELDIKLTGVSAEYGQFQGGLSNVITKSGSNEFTGSVRDEITSPSFESQYDESTQNEFAPGSVIPEIPGRGERELTHDVEVTFGGPVVRNTAWFFLSYNRSDTVAVEQVGNPTGGPFGNGTYADTFEGDNSQGKLTWQVTNNNKLQYNYFEDPALTPRCYGQIFFGGPCYDTPFVDNQSQGGFAWTGSWNAIWGNRLFTDVRVSHWENGFGISPLAPQTIRPDLIFESPGGLGAGMAAGHAPTIDLTTGTLFDAPIFGDFPESRERDQYEAKTTAFFNTNNGSHTLKVGADYQETTRVGSSILAGNAILYTLGWVEPPPGLGGMGDPYDVNNRIYYLFVDFAPPSTAGPLSKETAVYVQDDWVLNDHWSFNLGVRFEKFQEENDVGEGVIDQSDFAPRLGAAYDIRADGKMLIKATAARYLAGVHLTTLSPFVRAAGGQSAYDVYVNSNFPNPGPPTWSFLSGQRPDPGTSGFSPDLEPQRINEYVLAYEQAITPLWGVKVKLIDREWDQIIGQTFSYDYSTGGPLQVLFLSNRDDIERSYQAAILEVERRFSNNWTFRGNIIKAKAEGNTEDDTGFSTYGSFPGVPQTTDNRYGRLSFDVDMAYKLFGSYRIPLKGRHGLEVGATLDWAAGNRYAGTQTATVVVGPGADGVQDVPLGTLASAPGASTDQSATVTQYFQPRGMFQEPDIWHMDLLTRYRFKLSDKTMFEGRMEVINLTDEQNPFEVNDNWTAGGANSGFGYPTGYPQFQRARTYRFNFAMLW